MNKKEISKIITTGTVHQKATLLIENSANAKYKDKKILTKEESEQLLATFQEKKELDIYYKYQEMDKVVSYAITNLQGLRYQVLMHYANLRGYILLWNALESTELITNTILHEIKDNTERKRVAKKGAKELSLLFSEAVTDKEGYIDIKVGSEKKKDKPNKVEDHSLVDVIYKSKKDTETTVIKYISWKKATLDYMNEHNFKIKGFKDFIELLDEAIYTPFLNWEKYLTNTTQIIADTPHPRADKLISKYAICPNVEKLSIDNSAYDTFRQLILEND